MKKEQIEQRAQELYPKMWIDGYIVSDPLIEMRERFISGITETCTHYETILREKEEREKRLVDFIQNVLNSCSEYPHYISFELFEKGEQLLTELKTDNNATT